MPLYSYKCQRSIPIVTYSEPTLDGGNRVVRMPREQAIAEQRSYVEDAKALVRPGFSYTSDQQALDDFVTTHWAAEQMSEPCGHVVDDVQQSISEPPLQMCPVCWLPTLERVIGRTSFVLQGGGWAKDGYGSKVRSKES